jgi:hypothetical protein
MLQTKHLNFELPLEQILCASGEKSGFGLLKDYLFLIKQMKSIAVTLFFILVFKMPCFSQNNASKEIVALMKKQEIAWNAGDIEGFMQYYWKNDSLKFIDSKGITYGWQKTLDNYKKNYPNKEAMGILTFEIKTSEELSKTSVFIIGSWSLKKEKSVGGYFTLLWKKIKGEWVIAVDHTS